MCLVLFHSRYKVSRPPLGGAWLTSGVHERAPGAPGAPRCRAGEARRPAGAAEPECVDGTGSPPPRQERASWQRLRMCRPSCRSDELRAGKMGPQRRRARLLEAAGRPWRGDTSATSPFRSRGTNQLLKFCGTPKQNQNTFFDNLTKKRIGVILVHSRWMTVVLAVVIFSFGILWEKRSVPGLPSQAVHGFGAPGVTVSVLTNTRVCAS